MKTKNLILWKVFSFIIVIAACLYFIFAYGCASTHVIIDQPCCKHRALVTAMRATEDGYPVRVWIGQTKPEYQKRPNFIQYHVQSQAQVNLDWVWLDIEDFGSEITTSNEPNYWFTPGWHLTLEEYWQHWRKDWYPKR